MDAYQAKHCRATPVVLTTAAWHDLAMPDSVVVYSIRAEFADAATRERYLAWLREGHSAAIVRQGGALSGEVTVLEDGTVESRYVFGHPVTRGRHPSLPTRLGPQAEPVARHTRDPRPGLTEPWASLAHQNRVLNTKGLGSWPRWRW